MAQLQPNGARWPVQEPSSFTVNRCKMTVNYVSVHLNKHTTSRETLNIVKSLTYFPLTYFPFKQLEILKSFFRLLWICTNILQSCIETQDGNSNLIFFTFREYELVIEEFPYSWAYYKTENKWWTKSKNILFLTGVTIRQSKMTQQMSINYHTIRFHFHTVSIYFFFFLDCNSPEPDWKCTQWKWSSAELITFYNREMKWDSDIYDGNKQFYDWNKKRWKRKPHLEV